jgi:hypothetical protein
VVTASFPALKAALSALSATEPSGGSSPTWRAKSIWSNTRVLVTILPSRSTKWSLPSILSSCADTWREYGPSELVRATTNMANSYRTEAAKKFLRKKHIMQVEGYRPAMTQLAVSRLEDEFARYYALCGLGRCKGNAFPGAT